MRISFWRLMFIVLVAVAAFVFYDLWWAKQHQSSWIERFTNFVFKSAKEARPEGQEEEQPAAPAPSKEGKPEGHKPPSHKSQGWVQ